MCNKFKKKGYFGANALKISPNIALGINPAKIAMATPESKLFPNVLMLIFFIDVSSIN